MTHYLMWRNDGLREKLRSYVAEVANGTPADEALETVFAFDYKALEADLKEYLQRTEIHRSGAPNFVDKNPNNFIFTGVLKIAIPNAKIIDARRHPLDSCFGSFKQLFASGQRFSYNLRDIGEYYRDYVALMDHW